jgi:AcrR family transcriptional regulator
VRSGTGDPSPTSRNRSTRDRPAKSLLSKDAIVDAALEILRAEGVDAVTMRRVATALDTGPASLYVYVAGREGLFQAMLDSVTATIDLEPPDAFRWRDQLHSLLQRMHASLVAHPGMAAMTLEDPPTTETVLLLTENLMGILLAGKIEPQRAAWACDILVSLVTAAASEDDVRHARGRNNDADRREQIDDIHKTFAALPTDRFPIIAAHATEMVTGDSDTRFHFAIDVVIDGVLTHQRKR